ncbi:MAG TPA: regulatory protein RecX [Steroidobacteraceae bacterium]|jgi:regulatory protein|nr:regulatory protein RecX [Steroidobacteraceae bacterium]HEX5160162.1 regulatory protein RecX [Steroidobacteraceae bacterium]
MRRPAARKSPLSDLEAGDPNSSYAYAVALLARRDYSSGELRRKLADRGYIEIAIEPVVEELIATNKVNDERFGHNVVAYRARRGHGPARIRSQLMKSGLSRGAIDEAVKGEEAPDFLALARATRLRKFGPDLPKDRKERARQARFLQYRGFSNDHIRAVLEGDPELDSEPESSGEPDTP